MNSGELMVVPYTADNYEQIVSEYEGQGFELYEVQNITEGNFLIFGPPRKSLPTLEDRVEALESALLTFLFAEGDK